MRLQHRIINPGRRQSILFLHGFLGTGEDFRGIGREMERTHTVIYSDLPGHHGNLICASDSFASVAAEYKRLLETQSARYRHVVGYSMGGRLALFMGIQWPGLVQRLTLISASPGIADEHERVRRARQDSVLARKIEQINPREFVRSWYKNLMFDSFRESKIFTQTVARRCDYDPKQMALALKVLSVGKQPSMWKRLRFLPKDTEMICGVRDQKFCDIARAMQLEKPSLKINLVAQAGHCVHLEAEKVVKESVRNG